MKYVVSAAEVSDVLARLPIHLQGPTSPLLFVRGQGEDHLLVPDELEAEFLAVLASPVPPPSKAELTAYAADLRWRAEQAGTTWNDFPIHTDDRSQGKYLSELQAITLGARIDGDPWKFADGVFRPVSNAEFPQLAIAAREHVRTVFGIEAIVLAEIEAGTIIAPAQIEAAFS